MTRKSSHGHWLSSKAARRDVEIFFLKYSALWVAFFGGIVVTEAYEWFNRWHYLAVGLLLCLPPWTASLFFPSLISPIEAHQRWHERHSVFANAWLLVFSFIGNYFWTHYFYQLLGASYTFDAHRLNNVPIALILITHAYFILYHTLSTLLLRRIRGWGIIPWWIVILVMSYITAFMETWTIERFPYYAFVDRDAMYFIGNGFYALYFVVSFPMYYRMDEDGTQWTLGRAIVDAFGAAMIVTCLLDFWRLTIGSIVPTRNAGTVSWIY